MKTIRVFAKVFSDEGKTVARKKVTVEVFQLARNQWQALKNASTNNSGLLSVSLTLQSQTQQAPILRLVETGTNTPRVMASSPYLSYNNRSQMLVCDFGEVELLEETAFKVVSTQATFRADKTVLAGNAKRPEVSQAILMRNVNPTFAPVGTRAGGVAVAAPSVNIRETPLASDAMNAELIRFQANETRLQGNIANKDRIIVDKDRVISTKDTEIQSSRAEITTLKRNLALSQASETSLKAKNEVFTKEENRFASIDTIASNIGAQLDAANKKMTNESQPYQIQNVSLELNGSFSNDGKSIAMTRLADSKETLSSAQRLKLDLIASAQKPVLEESTVPDISGFTESMVRRILKSLGLSLDKMTKAVGSDNQQVIGQAISQSPAAGAKLPINGSVIVVFASE